MYVPGVTLQPSSCPSPGRPGALISQPWIGIEEAAPCSRQMPEEGVWALQGRRPREDGQLKVSSLPSCLSCSSLPLLPFPSCSFPLPSLSPVPSLPISSHCSFSVPQAPPPAPTMGSPVDKLQLLAVVLQGGWSRDLREQEGPRHGWGAEGGRWKYRQGWILVSELFSSSLRATQHWLPSATLT